LGSVIVSSSILNIVQILSLTYMMTTLSVNSWGTSTSELRSEIFKL